MTLALAPSSASGAIREASAALVGWLDDLLDMARDRGDLSLARLVAGVMDDLAGAAGAGGR